MARYVVSRLAITVVMALLATLVIFLIANTVPGDPVLAQLGDIAASNKEFVAEWRAKWGLDLPLWQRYLIFLQRPPRTAISASRSPRSARCSHDIAQFAPATLELATVGFLLALVVGIPLGILAAVRRDSWIDHLARVGLADRRLVADLLARLHRARRVLRRARRSRPAPGGSTRSPSRRRP